ncbi:MAG: 4-diphosphocytidyl-2-C-methyl-D-erythritol kinase [Eubacteriaceae bacterium]|jgi:4-diphosphocytidyl-2-C-methyl-D-erythritol kinase|nr:4-diphosphocytidyl-2-C-methyl-D-erythritol kinase [Eubacteriaceae bacterium]
MDSIAIKANAKVNLLLDVLMKRVDGYHEMRMINHRLDLSDTIYCKKIEAGIVLKSNIDQIPSDERNLCYRAAKSLFDYRGIKAGVKIELVKQIPHEAGLAGGSADAAATLLALNRLFSLGLTLDRLAKIGLSIGADVPYCLYQSPALVEGIGERITELESIGDWSLVLVKPAVGIKTSWAFAQLGEIKNLNHPDLDQVLDYLGKKEYQKALQSSGNVFEDPIFKIYPELEKTKNKLLNNGALAANMTGSGSTIVGYFADQSQAQYTYDLFKLNNERCFLTKTC